MSTQATLVAGWQRSNLQCYLTNAIATGPTSTATFALKNVGNGPWPKKGKQLKKLDLQSSGGTRPSPILSDFQLSSVERPAFPLSLPFQPKALAMAIVSCLQNKTGTPDPVSIPWTDPQAKYFLSGETIFNPGAASGINAGRTFTGAVVKTVKISVPPSGATGGEPTLDVDCLAYSSGQLNALTGAGTLDTTAPCQSTDFSYTIGGAAAGHCGLDLTIDNGLEVDPQVSATPAGMELGKLSISGTIKVPFSLTSGDESNTIQDAYEAGTPSALILTIANSGATAMVITIPALWDEPGDPEIQGNIAIIPCSFQYYWVDATHPAFNISGGAAMLSAWT
jgi:hypothetical protein